MNYETIILEKKEGIATITLNRPERLNAMNPRMREELPHVYNLVDGDDEIRVVVITGAGRAFSSGGDVRDHIMVDLERRKETGEDRDVTPRLEEEMALINIRKPTIAMVNGIAVGAACGIALVCDIVIASEEAKFMIPFVRRGTSPLGGLTYFLPRLVGIHKACEIIFTAKMLDAREAKEIGLVNEVVPAEELAETTYEMAASIAKLPPLAIRASKRLLYHGINADLTTQLQQETFSRHYLHGTQDFEESTRAFLEKREPVFKGK